MSRENMKKIMETIYDECDGDKDCVDALWDEIHSEIETCSDEDIFMDTEEEPISQHANVWDNTRDQPITYGDISLRFLNSGKKHHQGKKDIEITSGPHVWNEGFGWLVEVHGDKIYHVGHKPTDMRCYVLRTTKRRGSTMGPLTWDQSSLPSDHPISKKMVAEVKKEMNF